MKTDMSGISALMPKDDMKTTLKETKETNESRNKQNRGSHNFGHLDLWRMQKKHKSLGSSIRW